jgi:hypothetical protein
LVANDLTRPLAQCIREAIADRLGQTLEFIRAVCAKSINGKSTTERLLRSTRLAQRFAHALPDGVPEPLSKRFENAIAQ